MATHSNSLAQKIPWREEPGALQSMGSQSQTRLSMHTCARTHTQTHTHIHKQTDRQTYTHFVNESSLRDEEAEKEGENTLVGHVFSPSLQPLQVKTGMYLEEVRGAPERWGFIEQQRKDQCFLPYVCLLYLQSLLLLALGVSTETTHPEICLIIFALTVDGEKKQHKHNSKEAENFRMSLAQPGEPVSAVLTELSYSR